MKSVIIRKNSNPGWKAPYEVTFSFKPAENEDIAKVELTGDFQFMTQTQADGFFRQNGTDFGITPYNPYQYSPEMFSCEFNIRKSPEHLFEMKKEEDGVYRTVLPLPDGQFHYWFVLTRSDGTTEEICDPENPSYTNEWHTYFHSRLSVGERDKAGYEGYAFPRVDKKCGRIVFDRYKGLDGTMQSLGIYLPYGYDSSKKYPVVYVSHGGNGNELDWLNSGAMAQVFDNAIASGEIVPVIGVTMDHGYYSIGFGQWKFEEIAQNLLKHIIPFMEEKYSAAPGAENRAFCGLSMGGMTTSYLYIHYHREFFNFGIFSGSDSVRPNEEETKILKEGAAPYITCGCTDIAFVNSSYRTDHDITTLGLVEWLDAHDIPYVFSLKNGAHDFHIWIQALAEFLTKYLW